MKPKKPQKILQNITIDKLGYGGVGIGRAQDGKKVLVSGGVLPGSVIDVIVTRSRKDFFEGRVFFVHSTDPTYTTRSAPCPHYYLPANQTADSGLPPYKTGCGGCKWQQVSYDKQLELKQQSVIDSFRSIKSLLENTDIRYCLPSPEEFGYRNKIEYSFGDFLQGDVKNAWALGFHKQGQFSQIIDIDECLLVSPIMRNLFQHIKTLCRESGLPVYNQVKHTGFFRHLVMREGKNTEQILINFCIATQHMDSNMTKQWDALQQIFLHDDLLQKHITTWIISVNNGLGDAVFTHETQQSLLRGDGYIYEKLTMSGVEPTYRISANSFFQTNTHGAELLFSTAYSLLGHVEGPLIDLYCGTGTIGIAFAKLTGITDLVGIEIVPEAIIDAHYNAQINALGSAYFVAGKAEQLIKTDEAFSQACEKTDCIIVDPPRDGLHKSVTEFLTQLRQQKAYKLLYISCNPVTLARDIEILSSAFKISIIQPVDMFPHTHHVETICLLS